jgi:5-methylcytosine-specific restriction endonuclease McrA
LPTAQGEQERSRLRDASVVWRSWYKTARWQRLRWSVLLKACFTCAKCGHIEAITKLLVADHVVPHRGDEALFWDEENLQCLCKTCHDRVKQAEERRGLG